MLQEVVDVFHLTPPCAVNGHTGMMSSQMVHYIEVLLIA